MFKAFQICNKWKYCSNSEILYGYIEGDVMKMKYGHMNKDHYNVKYGGMD